MFTGIVAAVGTISSVTPLEGGKDAGVRLQIDAGPLSLADVALGDSIAINGACMTVVEKTANAFSVDVSRESLNCTVGLDAPGEVNLEKALTLAERLGGHLVSGHVDGLGGVHRFEQVGESWELVIDAPAGLAKFFAFKGSVVINGVSLTVNRVEDVGAVCRFSINLIPHTISVTTLKHLRRADAVGNDLRRAVRHRIDTLGRTRGSVPDASDAYSGAPSSCDVCIRKCLHMSV
jgi:riboflavin synthase